VDVKGAKALKERLGHNKADEVPPVPANLADDAPPVYQWLGVSQEAPETPPVVDDDEADGRGISFFRRLGLSFR
jgi:hypothetical protein